VRRLRFHARPVTWLIAAGVGVAIAARHLGLRRSKAEQAAVDRRVRRDRRSGVERRSPDGTAPEEERRAGTDRRSGGERRTTDSV
jgi:hypothetical protein